jgi:hypothetical protein
MFDISFCFWSDVIVEYSVFLGIYISKDELISMGLWRECKLL